MVFVGLPVSSSHNRPPDSPARTLAGVGVQPTRLVWSVVKRREVRLSEDCKREPERVQFR
jgi:hypothetical protein